MVNLRKWLGRSDDDSVYEDLTLARMKVGYLVDYDLMTWEVVGYNTYDYDGFITREWELKSVNEVRFLELIVNGRVVSRELFDEPKVTFQFQRSVQITESAWIAARTYAEAGTEAHTNPVYVYLGGRLPFNRDSARNIISRLDGSIETITNRDVVKRLKKYRGELENILGDKKHALPLPSVQDE